MAGAAPCYPERRTQIPIADRQACGRYVLAQSTVACRRQLYDISGASALHMQLIALDARNEDELEGLLPQIQHADADALIQSTEVLFLSNRSKIAEAVAKAKMPAVFPWPDHHDSSRWLL